MLLLPLLPSRRVPNSGVAKGDGPPPAALLWGRHYGLCCRPGVLKTFGVMELMKRLTIIYGAPQ